MIEAKFERVLQENQNKEEIATQSEADIFSILKARNGMLPR